MGKYLNPGKKKFTESVNSKIYEDKTGIISFLNSVVLTEQKYVSVSRPRRFGKSMTANMLCAYYGKGADSRELFETRKLATQEQYQSGMPWDVYLSAFDVISIVMTDFFKKDRSVDESLTKMQEMIIRDLTKAYPMVDYYNKNDLIQCTTDIYEETQNQFVIIIDEWDAVFRIKKDDREGQIKYLDFLRDWMKGNESVALAYITGILPIKKYGEHSALNMFDEYSMISPMQMAEYTGFTEDEVKDLCMQYGRDYLKIKEWYDGYKIDGVVPPDPDYKILKETGKSPEAKTYSLYSPLSVVNAINTGVIKNYWNKTETYEALALYIRLDYDGLKNTVALLMNGGRVKADLDQYQNDMTTFHSKDDIITLLIHLGYLCYDQKNGEVFIPNKEILEEFKNSTKTEEWEPILKSFQESEKLLEYTWKGDEKKVAECIEKYHDKAGNKTYNDEAALSYTIQLAYYAAQKYYTEILELDSGKGYADIVYLPSPKYPEKPALLIELKYSKSASGAIEQIKNRNYPDRLQHYKGNLLLVGINYQKDAPLSSGDFKHHQCVIEKA